MEKERAKMAKDGGGEHEAAEEGDGPRIPHKSKFVSDPFLLVLTFLKSFSSSGL